MSWDISSFFSENKENKILKTWGTQLGTRYNSKHTYLGLSLLHDQKTMATLPTSTSDLCISEHAYNSSVQVVFQAQA